MTVRTLFVGLIMLGNVALVTAHAESTAAASTSAASTSAASTPTDTKPAAFKVIGWSDLAPKDWDPLKKYRDANFDTMDDNHPKVRQMMLDMREAWDNAPTVTAMDGATVKLPGYLVPLEETKGGLKEFLLVPYFGACIHSPPPPANQIVHVVAPKGIKGFRTMDTVWVSGTLSTRRQDSMMGTSAYRIDAVRVERYVEPKR